MIMGRTGLQETTLLRHNSPLLLSSLSFITHKELAGKRMGPGKLFYHLQAHSKVFFASLTVGTEFFSLFTLKIRS